MAYGDYYDNPEDSFFGQESNFMNAGQDPYGVSQSYDDMFSSMQPNFQGAYEANLDSGMDPGTAGRPENMPNLTNQLFGIAFGDMQRTTDLENLRQQSYQQGINTSGSSLNDFNSFLSQLQAGLSESSMDMYQEQLDAGEEGRNAKLERLEDYRLTLEDQFQSNALGSDKMREYMEKIQAKGDARTAKIEDAVSQWMVESDDWRKESKKKFDDYSKRVQDRDDYMVETAQKARDDFELNLTATIQAKIAGMEESFRSTQDLLAMDQNMSDEQKAALKIQNKARYDAELQGTATNLNNEAAKQNLAAANGLVQTLNASSATNVALAQASSQNNAALNQNAVSVMNTSAGMLMQAQQLGAQYDAQAMGAGFKAIEFDARNEAMLSQGYAQLTALEGQVQDSFMTNISNAAQMFATNIFNMSQTMVQGKQIELSGKRDLAAMYTNRQFNYPVAMDAVNVVFAQSMALMSAGLDPNTQTAFGLGAAWQGNPFDMTQAFSLPDDYVGGGAAPMGSANFSGGTTDV